MLVLCQRQTSRNLSAACKTEHYNTQHYNTQHCNTVSQGTCAIWVFDFKEGYDENTRYKEEDFFHICLSCKCYNHATSIALRTCLMFHKQDVTQPFEHSSETSKRSTMSIRDHAQQVFNFHPAQSLRILTCTSVSMHATNNPIQQLSYNGAYPYPQTSL